MTKAELIAKQQLEIEELKEELAEVRNVVRTALKELIYAEQYSIKHVDFPKIAMRAIVKSTSILTVL